MDSENQNKSLVEEYLNQNRSESKQQIKEGSKSFKLAPLGKRVLAFILDRGLIFLISAYVITPIFGSAPGFGLFSMTSNLLIEFFYAGYFYSARSATPGKMIFKLQVKKESQEKLSFVEGGLRDSLGKLLSGIILAIGYFIAFFRTDRRTLHDIIFNTDVVVVTSHSS